MPKTKKRIISPETIDSDLDDSDNELLAAVTSKLPQKSPEKVAVSKTKVLKVDVHPDASEVKTPRSRRGKKAKSPTPSDKDDEGSWAPSRSASAAPAVEKAAEDDTLASVFKEVAPRRSARSKSVSSRASSQPATKPVSSKMKTVVSKPKSTVSAVGKASGSVKQAEPVPALPVKPKTAVSVQALNELIKFLEDEKVNKRLNIVTHFNDLNASIFGPTFVPAAGHWLWIDKQVPRQRQYVVCRAGTRVQIRVFIVGRVIAFSFFDADGSPAREVSLTLRPLWEKDVEALNALRQKYSGVDVAPEQEIEITRWQAPRYEAPPPFAAYFDGTQHFRGPSDSTPLDVSTDLQVSDIVTAEVILTRKTIDTDPQASSSSAPASPGKKTNYYATFGLLHVWRMHVGDGTSGAAEADAEASYNSVGPATWDIE